MNKSTAVVAAAVTLMLPGAAAVLGVTSVETAPQTRATGTILGRVLDDDGAPLPGVRITATSPALIGEQAAYSGPNGRYRLTLLPPGIYRLVFALQGFRTVIRENVDSGVRRVASIEVTMELASVEEAVTVSGRSPLVDVRTTKRSTELSDELRNRLPETRGVGLDLLILAVDGATTADGQPATAATLGGGSAPNFFGSPSNATSFQVDGVTVTETSVGGQAGYYSPDWFEFVEITTTGGGPEFGRAMGGVFNVVTKSGGNEFHGEGNFYFQHDGFVADNTQNISSAIVEFTRPELAYRYDFSFNLGGPLRRDKAWFFAGYQGDYTESRNHGGKAAETSDADRFFGKITWQLDPENRLLFSLMTDTQTALRPSSPFVEPEATFDQPSLSVTPNITWNSVLNPDTFLEVKLSGTHGYWDHIPVSEGPAVYELTTGILSNAHWGHYTFDRSRTDVQGTLSHYADEFAGDHAMKFGAEWEHRTSDDRVVLGANAAGDHLIYYTYFANPYLAYGYDPNVDRNTSRIDTASVYAQDDWTIGDRVTLNLGLRFDYTDIGFLDISRSDEPTFEDLSPRLGVNFDLLGDGRLAAHAFYGRFYEEPHGVTFERFDPNRAAFVGSFWNGTEYEEFFRVDPLNNRAIDPALGNVYTDQLAAGLDYQLLEDLSIAVRYVHKEDSNVIGLENIGNDYVPIEVTTAQGDPLTMWAASPAYDPFFRLVNNPSSRFVGELFRAYNGLQIQFNRRLVDDWSLRGSLLVQKAEGNADNGFADNLGGGMFDSPNDFVNSPGELRNSRRWVFKLQGSWLTPNPVGTLVGFQFDAASSGRWNITERFPRNPTGVPVSDRTVPIERLGSRTINGLINLNLRLERKFRFGQEWGDAGIVFDVFNVFNEDTVREVWERVPRFGEPLGIVEPRTYRLGFRWLF